MSQDDALGTALVAAALSALFLIACKAWTTPRGRRAFLWGLVTGVFLAAFYGLSVLVVSSWGNTARSNGCTPYAAYYPALHMSLPLCWIQPSPLPLAPDDGVSEGAHRVMGWTD